jgi:hypothetical protein
MWPVLIPLYLYMARDISRLIMTYTLFFYNPTILKWQKRKTAL